MLADLSNSQQPIELSIASDVTINSRDAREKIVNMRNETASINVEGDVLVENIQNSDLKLIGTLNSLRMKNIFDSRIIIQGTCTGTVYIERINSCKLKISGDQIRIHEASDSDVFLFAKNNCILEDCKQMRFYPNMTVIKETKVTDPENYWKCVQDFGFDSESSFKYIHDSSIDD